MKVREYSTHDFISITPQHRIRDVLQAFLKHRSDIACILDAEGRLSGIVTKYTVYRMLLQGHSLDASIEPAIRRQAVSFHQDTRLEDAKNILLENNVAHGVVLDENDRVAGVLGKADIIRGFLTETEMLLNQLSTLVESLQDAVISTNPRQQVITYNHAAEELFGLPRDAVLGKPVGAIFPQLAEDFLYTFQKASSREPKRVRLQSSTVIASFVPLLDWGNITGAMAVLKDITSYEKVARELETTKKLERTLDSALELAYDGVLITDEHGKITMANPAFLELYNLDFHEVVSQPASRVIPELPVRETLASGKRIEGEIREIHGKKCVVTLSPIIRSGKCEGAIVKIIFHQLDQWKDIFRRLEELESELSYYRGELNRVTRKKNAFERIISQDGRMEQLKNEAYMASQGSSTVLITGESGTGKELFAEAIHAESGRPGNFIKVNCAAIPAELLEAEFFGYADGAFTGARRGGKPGKFELADRGTLFLDEIGDMPLVLQAKLLRVLQEQQFERVGDVKTRKVDVRIVAATNQDLKQMVREGRFREDLYYRINVIHLAIPPLRERLDDIAPLCDHLIKKLNQKMGRNVIGITPETLRLMQRHRWSGNVRELENVLERAMQLGKGRWIEPQYLPAEVQNVDSLQQPLAAAETHGVAPSKRPSLEAVDLFASCRETMERAEKEALIRALEKARGNRSKAARLLNISRATFYHKLKKYHIREEVSFR